MSKSHAQRSFTAAVVAIALTSACGGPRTNTTGDEQRPHVGTELEAAAPAKKVLPLRVGDAAPELRLDLWIRGRPLKEFDAGKLYVVTFWSTWCGPSLTSLAHLSALQRDNEGVTFVAVAANERAPAGASDDREQRVRECVQRQRCAYPVAFDATGGVRTLWVCEAGAELLPRTFVVGRDGRIAWIGHPMQLDAALHDVLLGRR